MRSSVLTCGLALLGACGGVSNDSGDDDILAPDPAFEIQSSDVTLQPGEEFTKCFYFTMPNTEKLAVHKWVSDLTPGSHHMIMFRSITTDLPPDGTIDDCNSGVAIPVYGTQIEHDEVVFPDDDGFGKPLAQEIQPGNRGYFQMHYFNGTDAPITAHVGIKAYTLNAELSAHVGNYTKTDMFATYNNDIAIPPHATNYKVTATCPTIADNFWQMSTHSHKQSTMVEIREGSTMVLQSPDWEHPSQKLFDAPEFFKFSSGQMTWECTYSNLGDNADQTVRAGQSAKTNEMCMATGYYFPATGGPKGCVMDGGQCQCLL